MNHKAWAYKKGFWKGVKIKDPCVSHAMMGAAAKGYAYIELHGVLYPLCYRCTQILCGEGRPQMDEVYAAPDSISVIGKLPPAGKSMPRHVVIEYEVPKEGVVNDTSNTVGII